MNTLLVLIFRSLCVLIINFSLTLSITNNLNFTIKKTSGSISLQFVFGKTVAYQKLSDKYFLRDINSFYGLTRSPKKKLYF